MWERDQHTKRLSHDGKDEGLVVRGVCQVKTQPGKFYHEPDLEKAEKAKDPSHQQRNDA